MQTVWFRFDQSYPFHASLTYEDCRGPQFSEPLSQLWFYRKCVQKPPLTVQFRVWIPVGFPVLNRGHVFLCVHSIGVCGVWMCVCELVCISLCLPVCVQQSHSVVLAIAHPGRFLLSAHFHFGLVNSLPFKEELSIAFSTIKVLRLSAKPPHLSALSQ